ncbi:hypothetical protein AB0D08_32255 [Kitasatospora sp. NPDC048540]|uniref:hypothetical protein n=1 Tax=unclassified Kitasatospora TaxID=2633591 RepID=UPI000AA0B928|nr:hypothetical protein [Kitasatospora sp. MBT63]
MDHLAALPWELGRNRYRHAGRFDGLPDQVRWGSPGAAEDFYVLSRCASFLTRVVERAYGPGTSSGWATERFLRDHVADWGPHCHSPNARAYRAAFARGIPHFRPVTTVRDLLPGDLLSVDYNRPKEAVYSGHIVIVRRHRGLLPHPADRRFPLPVLPHVFEVVDCSSRPHGTRAGFPDLFDAYPDTRALGGAGTGDGVGYGHMVLYEDRSTGRIAGYRRSPDAPGAFTAAERPIAAARIRP